MTWPFENDTSAITKKLANRSIKADKRRNIFIIVTIAFAACLMTVLALYTFGKSHELKTFLQGRYQAAVIDVDLETINDLRQDSNIEMVGTEALVDSFRVDDYTLNVNFQDSNNLYLYSTEFVGNLPDKENEVAVSEAYLKHIGRPVELNQEIELPLQNGKNANFTVCGLLHDDGANRRYQVLVSDSFLQSYFQDHIPYNATLRIMGSGSFKEDELKNLIKSCLTPYGIREEQIAYSSSYFDSVDNSSRDMLGVAAISILIVIACSTVIYSLFYISVVGKVKEYGRLRVIGMTQKQIKRMVKRESWQLSRTSIPLGIVVGCLIGYVLVPKGWNWLNTLAIIVVISILTELSVVLSIRKPIKIAASISPIEAVRISTTTENEKLNTKKLRRKLTPENLAKIGFMRNHKKVILTLISLGFSGILLMSAATFLASIDEEDMARQSFGDKEFLITLSDEYSDNSLKDNPLDDSMMNLLTDSPYITDVKSIKGCSADILLPDKKEPSSFREIIGLSDDEFSSLSNNLLSEEISYQELVGKNGILIDDTAGMLKSWEDYSVALGDVVTIVSASGKKIELSVVGTIDMGDTDYNGTYFFVPENVLSEIYPEKKNFNTEFVINADVNQLPAAENVVLNAIGDNPDIQFNSFDDALSSIKMHMTGYQIPIYGLIVFIAIFGIINLCNTLMTNLVSRQQEFGVLQSIGLSNKQLYKMLRMECLYYVFGTMAITFVFGTAAGYILCQIFNQVGVFGKLHYTFPFLQVLLFFAVLVVIALIYSTLAIRYCHKQSLVDRIKTME